MEQFPDSTKHEATRVINLTKLLNKNYHRKPSRNWSETNAQAKPVFIPFRVHLVFTYTLILLHFWPE
jgi:hypothetical protein